MRYTHAILVCCFVMVLLSCSREETYKINNIDGVQHIENFSESWDENKRITLEFVRKVGELDAEDEHFLLFKPRDCVRDSKENNFVLHRADLFIYKYDPDWNFLTSFGSEGQGPGEINSTYGFTIDNNDILYVMDHGNMRTQKFTTEGEPAGSFLLPHQTFSGIVQSNGNSVFLGRSFDRQDINSVPEPKMLVMVDPEGNKIKYFADAQQYESYSAMYIVNDLEFTIDNDDNVYAAFSHLNRIEKYSPDGELIYTMTRPLNYPIEHKEVMFKMEVDGREMEFPDQVMSYVSYFLDFDSEDRLWVMTYNKQPEDKGSASSSIKEEDIMDFELFSKDGVLLTRVPAPERFYKFRIYDDLLYLIDPYFEMCVYIYKIVER
ncbi:6-bladed beta-propeller [candidate division KSB1 bacterium]